MRSKPWGRQPREEYTIRMTTTYKVLAYDQTEAEEEAYYQLERDIRTTGAQFEYEVLDTDCGEHDISDYEDKEVA